MLHYSEKIGDLLFKTYLDITEILDSFGDFFEMFVTDVKGNSSDDSITLFFFCKFTITHISTFSCCQVNSHHKFSTILSILSRGDNNIRIDNSRQLLLVTTCKVPELLRYITNRNQVSTHNSKDALPW